MEAVTKIFLSQERHHSETEFFRSYSTFNYDRFYNAYKKAFGPLYVLNDDTLAGSGSVKMHTNCNAYLILIPVAGKIHYSNSIGNKTTIAAGQMQILLAPANTAVEIRNAYKKHLVNFLHIRIMADTAALPVQGLFNFDIDRFPNRLVKMNTMNEKKYDAPLPFVLSIGKFAGRKEGIYHLNDPQNTLYFFAIGGAFEVQHRLLQPRDGLALWNADTIDFEALSNDAVLLVMELKTKSTS